MAATQRVLSCFFLFSLVVYSVALPTRPFDENEDGLDDRMDINRDGKADMVYVIPASAAGYGPGGVLTHYAMNAALPVAAAPGAVAPAMVPYVAYHHAAGVPLYHHIQPAVTVKDQLQSVSDKY